jgi:cardiolipin synthase
MNVLNLPNSITFIRIILLPIFVTALVYKRYEVALAVFIAAGISDALDGLMARLTNQKTILGAFLDPLADKFLMVTSYILFSVYGWIPTWLTIIVISRDLIVTLGWVLLSLIYGITGITPSLTGKAANTAQLVLIGYILLSVNIKFALHPETWMHWAVAVLTVSSGLQYVYRGLKQAGEK